MERIKLEYTHVIGDSKRGNNFFSLEEIEEFSDIVRSAHEVVKKDRFKKDELSFLSLPTAYSKKYEKTIFGDTLWKAKTLIDQKAKHIRNDFSDYVQIAIGGSALGAIALFNALGDQQHKKIRIHLPDNIDPEWIGEILDSIQIEKTFFNIISKSGGTVETLANFFIFYNALKKKVSVAHLKDHLTIMTNPDKGPLAELCKEEGFTLIPIPDSVHGRFSVLSPGGLLTAAVAGIDIDELLDGARVMDEFTEKLNFWNNPMLLYAAFHYIANTRKNFDTLIILPYSQKLKMIADWYSQMVAESLGKDGKGITPVKALGVTDQHSQLQLYNEGPKNKLVVFFGVDKYRRNVEIPEEFPICKDYHYLWRNSLNYLLDSSQRATAISLYNHGVPNFAIRMPEITPYYMGQLLMLLEKVIPILGKLYKVNAFDQPGVEESKIYARAMLGKEGKIYEEKRKEIKFYSNSINMKIA